MIDELRVDVDSVEVPAAADTSELTTALGKLSVELSALVTRVAALENVG